MEDLKYVWEELTVESARFILEQAEKKLQALVEANKTLTSRVQNVLHFSATLSIVLIGLIKTETGKEALILYWIALPLLIVILFMSLHVYQLNFMHASGFPPCEFLVEISGDKGQHSEFLFKAVQEIQRIIELNAAIYQKRSEVFFWVMVLLQFLIALGFSFVAMGSLLPKILAVAAS